VNRAISYIYIYREREREREGDLCTYVCSYIYIDIHRDIDRYIQREICIERKLAVKDLCLRVERGECFGFMGVSGA